MTTSLNDLQIIKI